ncbi:MAG: hydroxyacid dehydrogenase [Betaproteobacteria bacterium]|nr:hydroxyacid dehydrogenase [Betaproteobacteria bacterium]
MNLRVLLTDPIDSSGEHLLRSHGLEMVAASHGNADAIRALSRDCDAIIIRSKLPEDIFDAAPRLRAVTIHGTGTDLVPLESATRHGVAVANLPGGNAQSVAEYCAMAMLMLARNIATVTAALKREPWREARALGAHAREIAGMTAGIVGVGEIGRRLAHILHRGFDMRMLGNQRRLDRLPPEVEPVSLEELIAQADFVVLTCPLTRETHHLFDRARIAAMKPDAWLINVGRGAVVEEAALIDALRERRIAGAMLDVYEHYRLEPGHPLLALDNAVLTPHLAGMTRDSRGRMSVLAAEDTLRMLAGEAPRHLVNPEVWARFRERKPQDR